MKDGFLLHTDNIEDWEALTLEQRGVLITAIFAHHTGAEIPEMDRETLAVFRPIRRRLEKEAEAYEEVCRKRSEAGRRGAAKANAKAAKSVKSQQKPANADFADTENSKERQKAPEYEYEYEYELDKDKNRDMCAGDAFEDFWKEYPKKVGKADARKAWAKVKPSQSLVAKMMETLRRAKTSDQWTRDNGRFVPNPSTWLNQGRWEDDVATYPKSKPLTRFHNADERDDDLEAFALAKMKKELGV